MLRAQPGTSSPKQTRSELLFALRLSCTKGGNRAIPDLRPTLTLLQAQPAFRSFAARAKSGDDRTHSLPDKVKIRCNLLYWRQTVLFACGAPLEVPEEEVRCFSAPSASEKAAN